jgi:glycosyltransferase involved in cell wall biosynthesis
MRVLFITFYYPPLNSIASLRTGPMVEYLRRQGITVDVLTRYYDASDLNTTQNMVSINDTREITEPVWLEHGLIALPFSSKNRKRQLYESLPSPLNGVYNYINADIFHDDFINRSMEAFEKHLSGNNYDLLIASFGPAATIKTAKLISKQYRIPYLVDFRDAFITEQFQGIKLSIMKRMQSHLLADAAGFIFASEGMKTFFGKNDQKLLARKKSVVVYNAASSICFVKDLDYDEADAEVIRSFEIIKSQYDLVLLHSGTLYERQDINFFVNGTAQLSAPKLAIVFIGLNDIKRTFEARDGIFMLPKVRHKTSVYLQRQADALLLPVYKDRYTGWSGKTFEYLASGNLVLCSPGPQEDLLPFFKECPNVIVVKNQVELADILGNIGSGAIKKINCNSEKLTKEYWLEKLRLFIQNIH